WREGYLPSHPRRDRECAHTPEARAMSLFFGNLQENRIGPTEIPVVLTTALNAAEPLRFTNVLLANRTAGPITVTVHVVPVGSVASDATKVVPDVNVPPNDNLVFVFEIPLN